MLIHLLNKTLPDSSTAMTSAQPIDKDSEHRNPDTRCEVCGRQFDKPDEFVRGALGVWHIRCLRDLEVISLVKDNRVRRNASKSGVSDHGRGR